MNNLYERYLNGDRIALARIISLVENETRQGIELYRKIYNKRKPAYRIGITGPPGVGKSTLVNALIKQLANIEKSIGIIAVDPSSPFTGGAILGDRLRMRNSYEFDNVFVRSLASRGSLGGLSTATENIAEIMEGFNMDMIIIETVGVGQSELDIMEISDTVIVVLVPESGDSIQAMKSGIMEIGDIFVINKGDREGADRAVASIRSILEMRNIDNWDIPVLKTIAIKNTYIDNLIDLIYKHKHFIEDNNIIEYKRKRRKIKEIKDLIRDMFVRSADKYIEKYINSKESPYDIALEIIKQINKNDMEDIWKER